MPPSETITIRLPVELKGQLEALAVNAIETAVVIADSSEAVWVERSEVDEWLSTWGT